MLGAIAWLMKIIDVVSLSVARAGGWGAWGWGGRARTSLVARSRALVARPRDDSVDDSVAQKNRRILYTHTHYRTALQVFSKHSKSMP